jgi:hypothetical protein
MDYFYFEFCRLIRWNPEGEFKAKHGRRTVTAERDEK